MPGFNDLKLNPKVDRFLIKVKQVDNKTINSWKLSDLLQGFASSYYKVDLLRTILNALNNDINPKNIVIFDRTINYQYGNYDFTSLGLSSNVYDIYRLGFPISLFPNIKIFELNLIFKLYFDLNGIMKELERVLIIQNYQGDIGLFWLENYYKSYKVRDFITTVSKLVSTAISQIPDNLNNFKELIRKLEENTINSYQKYLSDSNDFNVIVKGLKVNQEVKFGHCEKYFTGFGDCFGKINRPIVAIYNPEGEVFDFLCSYHFNSKEENSLLFSIDEVTHKSPFSILVTVAGWVISPLISKKIKENKENDDLDRRYKSLQILKMEEEQLSKLYVMLEDLYQQNLGIEFESLKSEYFKNSFRRLLDSIDKKFSDLFSIYSFDIVDIKKK